MEPSQSAASTQTQQTDAGEQQDYRIVDLPMGIAVALDHRVPAPPRTGIRLRIAFIEKGARFPGPTSPHGDLYEVYQYDTSIEGTNFRIEVSRFVKVTTNGAEPDENLHNRAKELIAEHVRATHLGTLLVEDNGSTGVSSGPATTADGDSERPDSSGSVGE